MRRTYKGVDIDFSAFGMYSEVKVLQHSVCLADKDPLVVGVCAKGFCFDWLSESDIGALSKLDFFRTVNF